MGHVNHSEEAVATAAIEAHTRAHGMGDARTMARAVLTRVAEHRARHAKATLANRQSEIAHLKSVLAAHAAADAGAADA